MDVNEALSYADMHIASEDAQQLLSHVIKNSNNKFVKNSNYIKNEHQPNIKLNKNKVYNYKDLENFFEKFKKKKICYH